MKPTRRTFLTGTAVAAAASAFSFASPAAAFQGATMYNVRDYGALGDGVTNDAPAFQAAFDAAFDGGGIVFVPPGKYVIGAMVFANFLGGGSHISLRGSGSASQILVRNWACFQFANVDGLLAIQDLVFVGSVWDGATGRDCVNAVTVAFCGQAVFERCSFYGVGAWGSHVGADWGSVVQSNNCPIKMVDCHWYGCFGEQGVVLLSQLRTARFEDCTWIDIGSLDGVTYSKVGGAGNGPWVRARHMTEQPETAGAQNVVHLSRCLLDEGPGHSVIVDGPVRVHRVVLDDCMFNVLGTGYAVRLTNVERAHVTGGLIGWAHQSTDAIRLEDVGGAKLTEVRCKQGASSNILRADAACRYLRVEDCDFHGGVFSDALRTVVVVDGVEQ